MLKKVKTGKTKETVTKKRSQKVDKTEKIKGAGQLESILVSIREAVIVTDIKGKIIVANPASELITGIPFEEIIGHQVREAITLDCAKTDVSWFFPEALEGWRAVELPAGCSVLRPTGDAVPVAATTTPFFTPEGEYVGIVLVIRDLIEEVKAKRRQYEFLSFVSHQLRQPFGSLRLGLEGLLARKPLLGEPHREVIKDLHSVVLKFIDFINDLIKVSRLEEGTIDIKMEKVDLRAVVEETVDRLKGIAESKNVQVKVFPDLPEGASFLIKSDRNRLNDVLSNLIANAILYNMPRGSVTVKAQEITAEGVVSAIANTRDGREISEKLNYKASGSEEEKSLFLLMTVSDTGLGIPEDQHSKIFENFFRGRNVVRAGLKGTGLGLSIVKVMVGRMGGWITFESKENEGTTFYLIFPLGQ